MKGQFLRTLGIIVVATLGLSACGSGGAGTDGVCSLEEKDDAKILLEGLDTMPLGEDAVKAIEEGCKVSKAKVDEFMTGLLGQLNIDPSCASDEELQNIVGNWEGIDTSDISASCSEGGSSSVSPDPIVPEIVDTDGDGVADDKDFCSSTPAGTTVSEAGCPPLPPAAIDTDGDGVEDAGDKCPGTMKDWAVDGEGCAIIYTFVPPSNDFIHINFNQAPTVTASAPGYGANAYPTDWPIVIQFDQAMDVESVKAHVKLEVFALLAMVDVPLQFVGESVGHKTFTFKPLKPLKADWAYNVVIEKGVKGDKGTTLEDISWTFMTKK